MSTFVVPPKMKLAYENFRYLADTSSFHVAEATTCGSHQKHVIRLFDRTKGYANKNFAQAASLFVQELLRLQYRCPGSVLINTFEISENADQIACATLPYIPLNRQLDESKGALNIAEPKVIEKILNDILCDVEFLTKDFQLSNIESIITPENICYLNAKGDFFLTNWAKICDKNEAENVSTKPSLSYEEMEKKKLTSQDLAAEIKALALAILKIKKMDVEELEFLLASPKVKPSTYNSVVESTIAEAFKDSQKLYNLIERMLSRDPQGLPNLEEMKLKGDKIEKIKSDMGSKKVRFEESKDNLSTTLILENPKLLACCSHKANMISIAELETKQSYANFAGVKINDTQYSWPHVKEIQNTKLLVSLHHNILKSANLEIFEISKRDEIKKIYSLGEVSGVNGYGDVTYNLRRNMLGAISLQGITAYHLLSVDPNASNADDTIKLVQTWIVTFDFNPSGETMATIDRFGVCLLSDVNTDSYSFHLDMGKQGEWGRCRWSTTPGEPLLYVKYDYRKLNILDAEKKTLTLKIPVQLEADSSLFLMNPPTHITYWIDVCQSNGNLLAAGGADTNIKIFDKRESQVVKIFDGIHKGEINCVRWNPRGDMLVSSSNDGTAKLLDFKTGKILHTGKPSDGNYPKSVCFI